MWINLLKKIINMGLLGSIKYFSYICKTNKNIYISYMASKINIKEAVKNPSYYGGVDNPYEVIKVCEAWGLDKDAYLFNVAKYIARAGKKDPQKELEDLKKAVFYLNRKIENLQK